MCSFRGFGKDAEGNFPQQYWREIAARLCFIIIFEVRREGEGEGREWRGRPGREEDVMCVQFVSDEIVFVSLPFSISSSLEWPS